MYNVIRRPTNILVKPGDCPWQLQCLVYIAFTLHYIHIYLHYKWLQHSYKITTEQAFYKAGRQAIQAMLSSVKKS